MRKLVAFAALALAGVPAWAGPADVNAQVFYLDAMALQAKGAGALFDRRVRPMMAQMKAAGEASRAANAAATARGKPLYCVPEARRKKGMGAQEALAMLGRVPESRRRAVTLRQAWLEAVVREYPCP